MDSKEGLQSCTILPMTLDSWLLIYPDNDSDSQLAQAQNVIPTLLSTLSYLQWLLILRHEQQSFWPTLNVGYRLSQNLIALVYTSNMIYCLNISIDEIILLRNSPPTSMKLKFLQLRHYGIQNCNYTFPLTRLSCPASKSLHSIWVFSIWTIFGLIVLCFVKYGISINIAITNGAIGTHTSIEYWSWINCNECVSFMILTFQKLMSFREHHQIHGKMKLTIIIFPFVRKPIVNLLKLLEHSHAVKQLHSFRKRGEDILYAFQCQCHQYLSNAWAQIVLQDTQVFRYYRDLINFRRQGNPALMLRCINPAEAKLLDAATGTHIKFRLAGVSFSLLREEWLQMWTVET